MKGLVYKSTGSSYRIKLENEKFIDCKLSGRFRIDNINSTNPICVGDEVQVKLDKSSGNVIKKLFERKNYVVRKSVKLSKQFHIIASNINLCFLIVTPKNPETSTMFIDRFLASTLSYGIDTLILFNKIDDYDEESKENVKILTEIYKSVGYEVVLVSGRKKINIDYLKKVMKGNTCVFSGHSGVGKSTLINSLDPEINIKTLPISNSNLTGQHTTTFSQMYDLNFDSKIIDTPGIKGFGLYNINKNELKDYFKEFIDIDSCKFNNCTHYHEPGCEIKKRLKNGKISKSRYDNYISMLLEIENNFR